LIRDFNHDAISGHLFCRAQFQRRRRGIFVVHPPKMQKLRQERHILQSQKMPLLTELENHFQFFYRDFAPERGLNLHNHLTGSSMRNGSAG
jgi:hypothetical protein